MSKKLQNKVAIVTGGSKGIGASIALHLATEGAHVVVNYSSSKDEAEHVINEITQNGGQAIAIQANLSQKEDVERLFLETKKEFGSLDILVNNAGVYEFFPLGEITIEHFYKIYNLNVLGLLLASQEAIKYFNPNGGSIINISSLASKTTPVLTSVYSSSKAAVDAITKTLSQELGSKNIRVNSVNPGLVETEGVHAAHIDEGDFRNEYQAGTSLGRIGQPKDIAPAVVFLASDDAAWITGEILYITGGFHG